MTWNFDRHAFDQAVQTGALKGLVSDPDRAVRIFSQFWDGSLRQAVSVCSVPPVLDDAMAWHLLRQFAPSDGDIAGTFFALKQQPFVVPMGSVEWRLAPWVRQSFLQVFSHEDQCKVHEAALVWLEEEVRPRVDVDERLLDLFVTYHMTPKNESAGLYRWRELSSRGRALVTGTSAESCLTEQFAISEMTQELQQLGWISKDRLEPRLYHALYLYMARRLAESAPIFYDISETERDEWAVGVAKHCLANLVLQKHAPSKEGVEPFRYAEGLLWRANEILGQVQDTIGQVHVCTTLATLLARQGRYRPAVELLRKNAARATGPVEQAMMQYLLANALLNEQRRWRRGGEFGRARLREALSLLEQAAALLHSHREGRQVLTNILVTRSKAWEMAGNLDGAEAASREALRLSQEERDSGQESYALDRLGWVLLARAKSEAPQTAKLSSKEAVRIFQQGIDLARDIHDERGLTYHLRGLARAFYLMGDVPKAEETLEDALDHVSLSPDPVPYALVIRDLAFLKQHKGDLAGATRLLRDAQQVVKGTASELALRLLNLKISSEREFPVEDQE